MNIDPDEYDLRELRGLARDRSTASSAPRDGRRDGGRDGDRDDRERDRNGDRERRRGGSRRGESDRRGDRRDRPRDRTRADRDDRRTGRNGGRSRPDEGATRRADGSAAQTDERTHRGTEPTRPDEGRRGDGRPGPADRDGSRRGRTASDGGVGMDSTAGFEFGEAVAPGGSPSRGSLADSALESGQVEELFYVQSAIDEGALAKPYLRRIPSAYAAERVALDWLEFLVMKAGFRGALDALDYYVAVEWLSADAADTLRQYLRNFEADPATTAGLDADDHRLSLVYVARLTLLS